MECKKLKQIFLSILFLLVLCSSSQAIVDHSLYTVVIQVTDNTLQTRNKHLPMAFEQVIKRVSSSQKVLQNPVYETARQHLDRFISHYFYTQHGIDNYSLTLRFNEQMINNLMQKMGRVALGKNRPQILFWLVMEQDQNAYFINHQSNHNVADQITILAQEYGMPIILPLYDLTERVFINEADVINNNIFSLEKAAERYNTNTMLLGTIKEVGGTWVCSWNLLDGAHNVNWQTQGADLSAELALMVNQLADQLIVNNLQIRTNTPKVANKGVTLRINGVQSMADYAKILDHLRTLGTVSNVELGSVDGNQAIFIVNAEGGNEEVMRSLKLSNILLNENPQQAIGNSIDLTYRVNL